MRSHLAVAAAWPQGATFGRGNRRLAEEKDTAHAAPQEERREQPWYGLRGGTFCTVGTRSCRRGEWRDRGTESCTTVFDFRNSRVYACELPM